MWTYNDTVKISLKAFWLLQQNKYDTAVIPHELDRPCVIFHFTLAERYAN